MRTIQDQTWRDIPHVTVMGNPAAKPLEEDPEMKTWTRFAVMKVSDPVPFYPLFFNVVCPTPQFSKSLVDRTRHFAMRVGPENVNFGVFPAGDILVNTKHGILGVELVVVTELDEAKLENLEAFCGEKIELR